MRSTMVSPSATRPAITRLAEARKIGRHDGGTGQLGHTFDHGHLAFGLDVCTQAHHLVDVHETVFKDGLGDLGRAF